MTQWLQRQWVTFSFWHIFLLPVSWLFSMLVAIRSWLYRKKILKSHRLPVPVIVVGNINIGGTGKTPLVIWLADQLQQAGYRPGIISRGYGGKTTSPTQVHVHSDPQQVGDEPVLIAKHTQCPIYVHADRVLAAHTLLAQHPQCNVIISDDGLQHYRLQRDVEIVVIDGTKGLGNQQQLPAGPLREPISRLQSAAVAVSNGTYTHTSLTTIRDAKIYLVEMQLIADNFYQLQNPANRVEAQTFQGKQIEAVAGIGNPERFFQQLRAFGLTIAPHAYPDHHAFHARDFAQSQADIILMTEKDAVKCQAFAPENVWVLPVKASLNQDLMNIVLQKLRSKDGS